MGKYNFKDGYYNYLGENVENIYSTKFYSLIGVGDGQRISPSRAKSIWTRTLNGAFHAHIFSDGYINTFIDIEGSGYLTERPYFIGSGINKSILNLTGKYGFNNAQIRFNDFTIENFVFAMHTGFLHFYNCEILNPIISSSGSFTIEVDHCILHTHIYVGMSNTYLGVKTLATLPSANLNLFDQCSIVITKSNIDSLKNNYLGFNNCNLKIGSESGYTPLIGLTEAELRDDFVRRCTSQSITLPNISEYSETLPMGRWIFSNNSCRDGRIIKDSVIHQFEKRKFINLGFSDVRVEEIPIVSAGNIPASFFPSRSSNNVNIAPDAISLDPSLDISKKNTAFSDSKIIYLAGKYKLNTIDIIHNLPMMYGVGLDGTNALSPTPVSKDSIEVGKTYLVRANDKNNATAVYNEVTYNSSLIGRNNVFRGVANKPAFSGSDNVAVYEILDEVLYQTIQLRIVDKIPSEEIASGKLAPDYWYFVDYKDSTKKDGAIVYDGISYGATDSFVAKAGVLTYTPHANLKLRRCWHKDFEFKEGIPDYDFWKSEQKPLWADVLPEDPRCLMKNNSNLAIEMQQDEEGKYIASGHPDFYNSIIGNSGTKLPSYPIKGAYMQIRLVISTLNPM